MRVRLLFVWLLLGWSLAASAQWVGPSGPTRVRRSYRLPQSQRFSLELGTGFLPLHALLQENSRRYDRSLAELGQETSFMDGNKLNISLSGIYHVRYGSELVLTGCATRSQVLYTQYAAFGVDPEGRTRYNLAQIEGEWEKPLYSYSLTGSYRHVWSPDRAVQWYSEIGLGLVWTDELSVMPSITLIGLRFGGEHFYVFLDDSVSPFASLIHGGLGWHF